MGLIDLIKLIYKRRLKKNEEEEEEALSHFSLKK